MIHSVKIKKRSIELLFVISTFCGWQTSAQTFPSYTVETYEESEKLKRDNPSLEIESEAVPRNFMIVLTFQDTIPSPQDTVPTKIKVHIKVGNSTESGDFFQGTFTLGDIVNIPPRTYYGMNGQKHYIKVYLSNITAQSAKNYSIRLEGEDGKLSTSKTGIITR